MTCSAELCTNAKWLARRAHLRYDLRLCTGLTPARTQGPRTRWLRAPGHEPGLGVNYARPRGRGVNGMRE